MKPVLLVMAAGLGSRYGGLKQLDKIGPNGEIILELSSYDAIKAGFEKIVFILRKEIVEEFKELIGNKLSKFAEIEYVIQDMNNIPEGFEIPEGRIKPWGTGHAILCAKDVIKSPFLVINADDYYGQESFKLMYEYLNNNTEENHHAMVGYELKNTLSENGHVARGICTVENGELKEVVERTRIIKKGEAAYYTENEQEWIEVDYNSIVSMNMWGFMNSIFEITEKGFKYFLQNDLKDNPIKAEYYIPLIVSNLINSGKGEVKVMNSKDKWYGVTYQEDRVLVKEAIEKMINEGKYEKNLWEGIKRNGK